MSDASDATLVMRVMPLVRCPRRDTCATADIHAYMHTCDVA